jgi:hypothetical protein
MLLRDCHFESSLSTFIFSQQIPERSFWGCISFLFIYDIFITLPFVFFLLEKGEISTETPELLCYNGQKEEEELSIRLKRRKLI